MKYFVFVFVIVMSFCVGCSRPQEANAEFEIGGYPVDQLTLILIPEEFLLRMQEQYAYTESIRELSENVGVPVEVEMMFRTPIIILSQKATRVMSCGCETEEGVITEDDFHLGEMFLSSLDFDVDIMSLEHPVAFYLAPDSTIFGFHTLEFSDESQDTEQKEESETEKKILI